MKYNYLLLIALLFFSFKLNASSSYRDLQHGRYVSKSHLHYVFNKVKRHSDITEKALAEAFFYYEHNRYKKHLSPNYIGIADYTKMALEKRLYVINLHTGKVQRYLVAHGINSGAKGGRVWRGSNVAGSNKTPTGFFKVGSRAGVTSKKRYKYLSIDGLEWKNRNARKREIILHTAPYVRGGGRSLGCFAIQPKDRWKVFSTLKRALLYSYVGN